MQTRNSKIGFILFLVYLVLYGGFVLLNTFSPDTMELTPIEGVNLAILYGFGLIIAAFILAMLYGVMCDADSQNPGNGNQKTNGGEK